MSRVLLVTADRPLPLCDRQEERTAVIQLPDLPDLGDKAGKTISVTALDGFKVDEHSYYRAAVDALGYPMKPYQYELQLQACETDVTHLKDYLSANLAPGEESELLNLWVGSDREAAPAHLETLLSDLDSKTLEQFLNLPVNVGFVGQCRMTITI